MPRTKIQKQEQFASSLRNFRDATDDHAREKQLRIIWESRPDHFRAESREELRSYVEQFISEKENDEILGGDPTKLFEVFGRPQQRKHAFTLALYDDQDDPPGPSKFGYSRFPEMRLGGPHEIHIGAGQARVYGPMHGDPSHLADALNLTCSVESCTGYERADQLASQLSGALAATGWLSGAIFPAAWPSTPIGGDEEEGRWEPPIRYRVVDRFDLDELDSLRRKENPHDWLKQELARIALPFTVAIPGWSERLRRAFSLFDLGETSRFEALKVFYYAAALETLMLLTDAKGKQESDPNVAINARLKESVAWFLGTPADRTDLKKQVREIYAKRSEFVHNGDFNGEPFMSDTARDVVMRVIRKELGSPPPAPAA